MIAVGGPPGPDFMFHYGEGQALSPYETPSRRGFKPRLPLFSARGACPPRTLICLKQDIQDSQDFQDEEGSRVKVFRDIQEPSSGPLGPACL